MDDIPIGAPYHNDDPCPIGDKITKPTKELLELIDLLFDGIYSVNLPTRIKNGGNNEDT